MMIVANCPECDDAGPHPVIQDDDPGRHRVTVKCVSCYTEFVTEVD